MIESGKGFVMKSTLAASVMLVVAAEAAGQVNPPTAPGARNAAPNILCGMTIVPADPKVDRAMVKPAPNGTFTLRTITPPVCRESFPSANAQLKRVLPTFLGPMR